MTKIQSKMYNQIKEFSTYLNYGFIVCLLGYCIDQYDLGLFTMNRIASLKDLGLNNFEILSKGILLQNFQMAGLLSGGILFGILGDKWGRVKVLFSSIFLYSIGNIANSFVSTIDAYALCRFISGFGLAAEIGASITLVSESLPKHLRGYGIMFLIGMGHVASVLASFIIPIFHWRTNYLIGGILGIFLFIFRVKISNSKMFLKTKSQGIPLGNFLFLFSSRKNFFKFISVILAGTPIYLSGMLVFFAPEIAQAQGVLKPILPSICFQVYTILMILGDFMGSFLSQIFETRKKIILIYLLTSSFFILIFLLNKNSSVIYFYFLIAILGFCAGNWVLINSIAAEQFGINLRATVATSTPNFIRAYALVITAWLGEIQPHFGILTSIIIISGITIFLAFLGAFSLEETYNKDLDFVEGI